MQIKPYYLLISVILVFLLWQVTRESVDSKDIYYVSHIHDNEVILKIRLKDDDDSVIINRNLHPSQFEIVLKTKSGHYVNNSGVDDLYLISSTIAEYVYIRVPINIFRELILVGASVIDYSDNVPSYETFYAENFSKVDQYLLRPALRLFFKYIFIIIQAQNTRELVIPHKLESKLNERAKLYTIDYIIAVAIFQAWILIAKHRIYIFGFLIALTLVYKFITIFILTLFYLTFLIFAIQFAVRMKSSHNGSIGQWK